MKYHLLVITIIGLILCGCADQETADNAGNTANGRVAVVGGTQYLVEPAPGGGAAEPAVQASAVPMPPPEEAGVPEDGSLAAEDAPLADDDYYDVAGIHYFFWHGHYFYWRHHARCFVKDLPPGGLVHRHGALAGRPFHPGSHHVNGGKNVAANPRGSKHPSFNGKTTVAKGNSSGDHHTTSVTGNKGNTVSHRTTVAAHTGALPRHHTNTDNNTVQHKTVITRHISSNNANSPRVYHRPVQQTYHRTVQQQPQQQYHQQVQQQYHQQVYQPPVPAPVYRPVQTFQPARSVGRPTPSLYY